MADWKLAVGQLVMSDEMLVSLGEHGHSARLLVNEGCEALDDVSP